jgi:hypothetical protein
MSEDNTTLFYILIKVISENLVVVFTVLTELFNAAEDPYLSPSAFPTIPAPFN